MGEKKDEAGQIIGWSLGGRSHDKKLDDLLTFPTDFTIKVILKTSDLAAFRTDLDSHINLKVWRERYQVRLVEGSHSKSGNYQTLLVQFEADKADIIYAMYAFVQMHPLTHYVL